MLSRDELALWYEQLRLPAETRAIIDQIRSSNPARRVGGGRRNVTGRYPSRKMGVTIQFESHRVELAAIYEMEHASDTLEYYDQPQSIKLLYEAASGQRLGVLHTPDFFVCVRTPQGGKNGRRKKIWRSSSRTTLIDTGRKMDNGNAHQEKRTRFSSASPIRFDPRRRSIGRFSETCSSLKTIFAVTLPLCPPQFAGELSELWVSHQQAKLGLVTR